MLASNEEIVKVLVISTLIILFFAVLVIIAILKYRNKQKEFVDRENAIKIELIRVTLEAKEHTMEYLSERIHIDIQQSLSLAKLNLNKILIHPENIDLDKISQIKELIADTIAEVKSLSKELDPKYIVGHTLEENIIKQLSRVEQSSEITTVFNTSEVEISPNQENQTFIYRIVQEAINNILTHAKATQIRIDLTSLADSFRITIEDNGIGFNTSKFSNANKSQELGIGLMNMKSRTKLMKGTLTLKSSLNNGTSITLNIPYDS